MLKRNFHVVSNTVSETRNVISQEDCIGKTLKWYYDQKSPYLFFLHFESMIYNYLPCQILGHDFNEKSKFLDFELSIKLPAITQFKNGRVQKRVGSREDVTSSNQEI